MPFSKRHNGETIIIIIYYTDLTTGVLYENRLNILVSLVRPYRPCVKIIMIIKTTRAYRGHCYSIIFGNYGFIIFRILILYVRVTCVFFFNVYVFYTVTRCVRHHLCLFQRVYNASCVCQCIQIGISVDKWPTCQNVDSNPIQSHVIQCVFACRESIKKSRHIINVKPKPKTTDRVFFGTPVNYL